MLENSLIKTKALESKGIHTNASVISDLFLLNNESNVPFEGTEFFRNTSII